MQLEFFRKYQRFFFLIITIVIVISFSFFGTYSTLSAPTHKEQIAFTAVDGSAITRGELEEMSLFLGTDMQDKLLFGGLWGPNFFNDGVIKKDFLATGMGTMLAMQYSKELRSDFSDARLEKEKRFVPYSHPQAKFVGVNTIWTQLAPEIITSLENLRNQDDALSPEAFQDRVKLFLAEQQFPPSALRQILHYQQQQYQWLTPDPNLDRVDLAIFGYNTTEDWFGSRFVHLISEFVINAAIIAEQRGYTVSKEEALASLISNAQTSFEQVKSSPYVGVASGEEYFQEQLRRMGMDQTKAVKLWRQVLLFRRLFHDFGNSVIVPPLVFQKFSEYSLENASGDLYRLPPELRLANFRSLQKLETYLSAVANRPNESKKLLELPTTFYSVAEVEKNAPELVQKRYLLNVAQVDKRSLQTKVGLKETWKWETETANWELLKKTFPELAISKATTPEERFAALDKIDDTTRAKIDAFARAAIVDSHPEWLDEALNEAGKQRISVGLRTKGGTLPFVGVENKAALEKLLDAAPVVGTLEPSKSTPEAEEAQKKLNKFTANQRNYYRIVVIDRAPKAEILTFAEANRDGTLDKLVDQRLEAYYKETREKNPAAYQKADKSWKPLADVADSVGEEYFAKILRAIQQEMKEMNSKSPTGKENELVTNDQIASKRFVAYMRKAKAAIQDNPSAATEWYREPKEEEIIGEFLPPAPALTEQWKLEKTPYKLTRNAKEHPFTDKGQIFQLTVKEWSPLSLPVNGDISFFQLEEKGAESKERAVAERTYAEQQLLSADAQRILLKQILGVISTKGAISFEYMLRNTGEPSMEPETE